MQTTDFMPRRTILEIPAAEGFFPWQFFKLQADNEDATSGTMQLGDTISISVNMSNPFKEWIVAAGTNANALEPTAVAKTMYEITGKTYSRLFLDHQGKVLFTIYEALSFIKYCLLNPSENILDGIGRNSSPTRNILYVQGPLNKVLAIEILWEKNHECYHFCAYDILQSNGYFNNTKITVFEKE